MSHTDYDYESQVIADLHEDIASLDEFFEQHKEDRELVRHLLMGPMLDIWEKIILVYNRNIPLLQEKIMAYFLQNKEALKNQMRMEDPNTTRPEELEVALNRLLELMSMQVWDEPLLTLRREVEVVNTRARSLKQKITRIAVCYICEEETRRAQEARRAEAARRADESHGNFH